MSPETRSSTPVPLSVLLCRDCCCGTYRKHYGFNHRQQEIDLKAAVTEAGGKLLRVNCLDACSHSNVVVLRTQNHGRIWFGGLADEASHEALVAFVRAGARGEIPPSLRHLQFTPTPANEEVERRCNLRGIPVY